MKVSKEKYIVELREQLEAVSSSHAELKESFQESIKEKENLKLDFEAKENIITNGKLPIICGGTGLYLDALIKNLDRIFIPENEELRLELELLDKDHP